MAPAGERFVGCVEFFDAIRLVKAVTTLPDSKSSPPDELPMLRRSFLAAAAATTVATSCTKTRACEPRQNPIAVFAKHIQEMPVAEMARRLKSIGVDGIEATLRKGGQIAPENITDALGKLVDTLATQDQRILIAASNVNQINKNNLKYLEALSKHGIQYFRMEYYRYDAKQPILPQLEQFHSQASELALVCESLGLTGLYQNHAGAKYAGAALWDLHQLLGEIAPEQIAVALDIRHTTLELTQSYSTAYRAIRPRIGATYVKDYAWVDNKPINVPLGQGQAKPLFDLVQKDGFVGPLSLHMEYTDHRDPEQLETSWQAIAKDVKTLQQWLA